MTKNKSGDEDNAHYPSSTLDPFLNVWCYLWERPEELLQASLLGKITGITWLAGIPSWRDIVM